jgi:hypothetical protein
VVLRRMVEAEMAQAPGSGPTCDAQMQGHVVVVRLSVNRESRKRKLNMGDYIHLEENE